MDHERKTWSGNGKVESEWLIFFRIILNQKIVISLNNLNIK